MNVIILLIHERSKNAVKAQTLLTSYGDIIRTRLGINRSVGSNQDGASGFIFLEVCGSEERIASLANDLNALDGIKAERMKIEVPGCSCCS